MPTPLDSEPTVEPRYSDDRRQDVVIQYSKSNIMDENQTDDTTYFNSTRRIEVTIIEERDDEIEVRLEVVDNTNRGQFALGGSTINLPPEDEHTELSETVVFDKSDIPYYQDNFPDLQTHIPIGERIAPNVREWSQNEPFRA